MVDAEQLGLLANFYSTAWHTVAPAWLWLSSFLILVIIFLLLVGYARLMGFGPFVAIIAGLYIGYALYIAFPYANYLPSAPAMTALAAHVALYLGFSAISYLILRKVAASDFVHIGTLGLVLISFFTAGFVLALAYQIFPVREVYHFSPSLDHLFAAKEWFFAWFAAPLISLFIFAK